MRTSRRRSRRLPDTRSGYGGDVKATREIVRYARAGVPRTGPTAQIQQDRQHSRGKPPDQHVPDAESRDRSSPLGCRTRTRLSGSTRSAIGTRATLATSRGSTGATGWGVRHHASTGRHDEVAHRNPQRRQHGLHRRPSSRSQADLLVRLAQRGRDRVDVARDRRRRPERPADRRGCACRRRAAAAGCPARRARSRPAAPAPRSRDRRRPATANRVKSSVRRRADLVSSGSHQSGQLVDASSAHRHTEVRCGERGELRGVQRRLRCYTRTATSPPGRDEQRSTGRPLG